MKKRTPQNTEPHQTLETATPASGDTEPVKTSVIAVQETTEDSPTPAHKHKRRKRRTKAKLKEIRKEGGITWLKVVATALTAITMAILSAKLTGYINSLLLVGLVSVGTAIISELYRVILSITSFKAQEVLKINSEGITETLTVVTDEELEAYRTKNYEKIAEIEKARAEQLTRLSEERFAALAAGEYTTSDDGSAPVIAPEQQGVVTSSIHDLPKDATFFEKLKFALKRNEFLKMTLLFAGIALVTITATFFISNAIDQQNVTYTTIEKQDTITKEITEKQKAEIIDAAIKSVSEDPELQTKLEARLDQLANSEIINSEAFTNRIAEEVARITTEHQTELNTRLETAENTISEMEEKNSLQEERITKLEALIQSQQGQVSNPATGAIPRKNEAATT